MLRTPLLTALFGLMISTGAAAAARGEFTPATVTPDRDSALLQQSVQRSSTEVTQLQRDVAAQERRSREADERLREQDRRLEQLRRQLHSVQGGTEAHIPGQ
jgi:septal ring factor EnvC (AmiA/AmiB activator)